jgi:hypothetical protein
MLLKKFKKIQICQLLLETCTNSRRHSHLHLDTVSNIFNETLIFADFLKKKCQRKRREQRGSTVFPLLFFPQGRIRSTRREKKNQNLLKNHLSVVKKLYLETEMQLQYKQIWTTVICESISHRRQT